ncbi:hypothetical protein B0H17DRAFT_118197 [Mycena rosella]|uniref:F-box domain-containing protein n=1 Tax=Mycena rosella TaxID=1033263 RepID=A0AAD7GRB1_MYCRO|nr:hypothetical protein B0H17DRAFT_118197 [Mycena rosella]
MISAHRDPSSIRDPPGSEHSSLPMELWDLVFQHLPDTALLITAAVCRFFNERCILIQLLTNGIAMHSVLAGDLDVDSHLLAALQRSFFIAPIVRLVCRFPDPTLEVGRHLRILEDIIGRSQGLQQVDLHFSGDLLQAAYEGSLDTVVVAFREVICALSAKRSGPAIFLDSLQTLACWPGDLRAWQFHECLFTLHAPNARAKKIRWLQRLALTNQQHSSRTVENHSGESFPSFTIARMQSVHMRSLGSLSGPVNSCTLIVNDAETRRRLWLGGKDFPLSSAELTSILPHLTLPKLADLHIHERTINPSILSDFLRRHPAIARISYTPEQPRLSDILVEPPVELPELIYIGSHAAQTIPQLLDGLAPSSPEEIGVPFIRRTRSTRTELKAALRSIAARRSRTCLVLTVEDVTNDYIPLDSEEKTIAQSLRCVNAAVVRVHGIDQARSVLPWLVQLPALRRLAFNFTRLVEVEEQTLVEKFRSEVIAILPNIAVLLR